MIIYKTFDEEANDRVRASVNPTVKNDKFLIASKTQGFRSNRIIAERARDSSGRIPLYMYSMTINFINFCFLGILEVEI